jgi:hypothetical protein
VDELLFVEVRLCIGADLFHLEETGIDCVVEISSFGLAHSRYPSHSRSTLTTSCFAHAETIAQETFASTQEPLLDIILRFPVFIGQVSRPNSTSLSEATAGTNLRLCLTCYTT